MAGTSTSESHTSGALRELSKSDAGPLELERKSKLGKTEWKKIWLAFHLDAWAIGREKKDEAVPSDARRWRGAQRLRLSRHKESTVEKCPSVGDEGPHVCFVVRCRISDNEMLEYRFRAETETCADWWCWAFAAKIRPWDELFDSCRESTLQASERPTAVTRLDGEFYPHFVSEERENLGDGAMRIEKGLSLFVDTTNPSGQMVTAINNISNLFGDAVKWVPVAGPAIQFVLVGVKIAALAAESGKNVQKCSLIIRHVGTALMDVLSRAIDFGDENYLGALIKILNIYEECVRDFESYLHCRRVGRAGKVLSRCGPEEILERLENCRGLFLELRVSNLEEVCWKPQVDIEAVACLKSSQLALQVPPVPQNLIFDLDDEDRPESNLKNILLGAEEQYSLVVAKHIVVGVHGLPGSGKTTVCVGLAKDQMVVDRFDGGIMWIQDSKDRTVAEVLSDVGHVAKVLGYDGKAVDHELESREDSEVKLRKIIKMAREAGKCKRSLILVDDVWRVSTLKPIVSAAGDSGLVVFTSRKRDIVADMGAVPIQVGELSEKVALLLVERWSGRAVSEEETKDAKILVNEICGRLAMAVKIAGATLGRRHRRWASVIDQLKNKLAIVKRPMGEDVNGYVNIEAMIAATYEDLAEEEREALVALCVVVGRSFIAVDVLRKLWGKAVKEAERIAEDLGNSGLVEYAQHGNVEGVRVHDVVVAFAGEKCTDSKILHRRMVGGYAEVLKAGERETKVNEEKKEGYYINWWEVETDDYFEHNILRHLEGLSCFDEVVWTVCQKNWKNYQMRNGNVASYSNDVERAIRLTEKESDVGGDLPSEWNTSFNLGRLLRLRMQGEMSENMERSIKYYKSSLEVVPRKSHPDKWAMTMNSLGNAYVDRMVGKKDENIEEAIKCYKASLEVYSRESCPYDWAMTMNNLGIAYRNRTVGKKDENIEEAIKFYKASLEVYSRESCPYDWARVMNSLGNAYWNRTVGKKDENIEEAIKHYKASLEVYSRASYPYDWAMNMNNLGNAYVDRMVGKKNENIEEAIKCYKASLEVCSRESCPHDWARTMNNLGIAYVDHMVGKKDENIEEAIKCYKASLEVRSRESCPYDWARVMNSLGIAYWNRIIGKKGENIEEAIKHYKASLEVYSRASYPYDWATTMNNLGIAYKNRTVGKKDENIEEAIKCYKASLEVYSRESCPYDWARVMNGLGIAYCNRTVGKKDENIEEAIKCYKASLEVCSQESYPHVWAQRAYNLGLAFDRRVRGDRKENLEKAIEYLSGSLEYKRDDERRKYLSHLQQKYREADDPDKDGKQPEEPEAGKTQEKQQEFEHIAEDLNRADGRETGSFFSRFRKFAMRLVEILTCGCFRPAN